MTYHWRASEASKTLSGLFNRESRYVTGHGKRDHFNKVIKCSYEQVKF